MRFLKTTITRILLKAIEALKRIVKNVLKKIKSKIANKNIITGILTALIIFTISWVILSSIVLLLFDVKRSSIVNDPDNFLKYRLITMTFFFFIIGFIKKEVKELVNNYGSYGILSVLSIVIAVWLLYHFIGW